MYSDRPDFQEIIIEIESIIYEQVVLEQHEFIDSKIDDETGRQFWKENFLGKPTVSWHQFSVALGNFLVPTISEDDMIIQCTQLVVAKEESVSISSFSLMCSWFGPLFREENPPTMLLRVFDTFQIPSFHGVMSGLEAENILKCHRPGSYLVRLSTRKKGCYCISVGTKDKQVVHFMYTYDTNTQKLKASKSPKTYPTLAHLISHHIAEKTLTPGLHIECTKYRWIFEDLSQMPSGYTDSNEMGFLRYD